MKRQNSSATFRLMFKMEVKLVDDINEYPSRGLLEELKLVLKCQRIELILIGARRFYT